LFDVVFRPMLRLWLRTYAQGPIFASRSNGHFQVHASGADADRILLVIDRPSAGDGGGSQELGLAGHLARQLSLLSGRGTDIDILSNGNMNAAECARALAGVDLARFDSVILMVGSSEALALTSVRRWSSELGLLLDAVDARAPMDVHVFVVEIPPVRSLLDFPRLYVASVQRRVSRLNAATRAATSSRSGVTVLPFDLPQAATNGRNSSEVFKGWAEFIAPSVSTKLALNAGLPRQDELADEGARQQSLDDLHILDTSPEPRIDAIVDSAHRLLGMDAAAVTFLDHDRRWVKSSVGTVSVDSPRIGSLCDLAIAQAGVFVVENVGDSPLYREKEGEIPPAGFYAGYPLETLNGRRIGVLCVMDAYPRTFTPSDASLLRDLALQVQAELWSAS
jgi:hypothetical protein